MWNNPPKLSLLYSGILSLFYIGLAFHVIFWRYKEKKGLGHDANPASKLFRAVRIHGNFMEYVPLVLLLLTLDEVSGSSTRWLHGCGLILIYSRIMHTWGIMKTDGASWQRFSGVATTLTLTGILAIRLIMKGLA